MNTSIDQTPARLTLVSNQRLILLLILLFAQRIGFGQNELASVLTKNAYLSNPTQYLSKVNPKLIPSGILIDRVPFDDLILNVNGKDKVTTIAVNDWVRIFNELKYANADTSYLGSISRVERITDLYYEQDMTYPIGILDFNFNRIEQGPLDRGELVEDDEFLDARRAKASSFSKRRVVVASCLSHSIYGDNVNFVVSNLLYAHNIKDQVLVSVEVDFDNGEGFKRMNLSETVQVQYSSASEFLEIKTKLTYQNSATGKVETYYAHSSVFRTGTSTVPLPGAVSANENGRSNTSTKPLPPGEPIYYPYGNTRKETICKDIFDNIPVPYNPNDPNQCCCETFTRISSVTKLETNILFSSQNKSGKLRRPFIITDGFDPGNKRDYYRTDVTLENDLPLNYDTRGLFQLINGDPSPYYSGPTPNLIAALQADGYDIVIINFLDGAGDIPSNASTLRGFFSQVLNSSKYRDNKTEEAILVGPSMGGVITRYMLRTMEKANPQEDPFVKIWISFDSPQQGANIPIGLQRAVDFLASHVPIGKEDLKASLAKLNTPAASQLLLYHYRGFGPAGSQNGPTTSHSKLYQELGSLGYPTYTKNYGITNGGTTKLYPKDKSIIVDFRSFAGLWAYSTSGSMLDNAPGGWNNALYSLNSSEKNKHRKSPDDIVFTRAAFIPTTSSFGIKVTDSNIAKTWKDYKASDTPFDVIQGMEGINEEHVKISAATRDYLIKELRLDFDNTIRPRIRSGQVLNQTVKGKVAITSKISTTFAGSGNSYTLESGADVVASAGSTVVMSPGFTAKAGSNFVAKIQNINYNTVLRSAIAQLETQSVDFTQVSPYTGTLHSYAGDEVVSEILPDLFNYTIYPNPLDNFAAIDLSGLDQKYAALQIYNSLGQLVYQGNIENGRNALDLSRLDQGIYLVKIIYNGSKIKTSKLIKS